MNLIKYRYLYFAISLLVIIPGVLALIFWGLPLGIDFTGGSLLEVQFKSGTPPSHCPGEHGLQRSFHHRDGHCQSGSPAAGQRRPFDPLAVK